MIAASRWSWTQPLCESCWAKQRPGEEPVKLKAEHCSQETCCTCGERTRSGIYIRVRPTEVRYPTHKDEA